MLLSFQFGTKKQPSRIEYVTFFQLKVELIKSMPHLNSSDKIGRI